MTHTPRSLFDALDCAGRGPARLMLALGQTDDRVAAFDIDLAAHPLCRPGPWQALLPPVENPPRLDTLLARLGHPDTAAPPVASGTPARHPDLLSRSTGRTGPAQPLSTRQPKAPAAPVPPPAETQSPSPVAPRARFDTKTSVQAGPPPARAPETGAVADRRTTAFAGLTGNVDPVLVAAAARRVLPAATADMQRLIADLVADAGTGPVTGRQAGPVAATMALSPPLQKIARALDRIAETTGPQHSPARRSSPFDSPVANAPAAADYPALSAGTDLTSRQPAAFAAVAGTGIERLLARGQTQRQNRGQTLGQTLGPIPAGPDFGELGQPGSRNAAPSRPVPAAVPASARGDRMPPLSGPVPEPEMPAIGSDAFARVLTDLLRHEARAAGIDLRGGR